MLTSLLPYAISPQVGTELSESKGMLMAVVTSAGIIIVFVILLLLIFIFYAYGGIFRSVTSSRQKKAEAKKAMEAEKPESASPEPAQVPEPVEGEIPGEIIAVIAAAVAAMSGGRSCAIRKITRSQRQSGQRGSWAAAGVYENTRPF